MSRYYNAYVIKKNGKEIFFGGDSGYGPFFKQVGKLFSIDIAFLGIGAYCPDSFQKMHKSPEDSLRAFIDLRADSMIPIHYGDFRLSLEPMDEPPKRLRAASKKKGISDRVHILENGESFVTKDS